MAIISSGFWPGDPVFGLLVGLAGTSRLALAHLAGLLAGSALLLRTTLAGLLAGLPALLLSALLAALAALAHSALLLSALSALLPLAALLAVAALVLAALAALLTLAALVLLAALLTTRLLARPVHIFIRHRNFPRIGCFVPPIRRKLIVADFVPLGEAAPEP